MANPIVIRYDLDRTGKSPNNRVAPEPHELVNRQIRPIAPLYGPFFAEGLVVRDALTNQPLTRGTDYKLSELYVTATMDLGKEIYALILITNRTVSSKVEIEYQTVGGEYSYNSWAIVNLINKLNLDNRPVSWPNIIGKPDDYNPSPHAHDPGDKFGMEYEVQALNRIADAILLGDRASHDEILSYIDGVATELRSEIGVVSANLTAHIGNKNNPHGTNKTHVGLSNVDNYKTASTQQASDGTATNLFVTPAGVAKAIKDRVGDTLTDHIANRNNPHQTNKGHVGLGNVDNFATAKMEDAVAGVAQNLFMTPFMVASYVGASPLSRLVMQHIDDKNNPHGTNKTHVGLGNVENFAPSTKQQAELGTVQSSYMTPIRVKEAINAQIRPLIENHIADKNNPHDVTPAKIGTLTAAEINTRINTCLPLDGSRQMTGLFSAATRPFTMAQNNWDFGGAAYRANPTGTGDNNMAGFSFLIEGKYHLKQGMRADGSWGIGGGSSPAWRFYSNASGDVVATGNVTAYSDKRLKVVHGAIPKALDRLCALTGVDYSWNELACKIGKNYEHDFGLIAQEVEAQFPEAVVESIDIEGEKYKTVSYQKLVAPLIEAVKELSARVMELESRA